MPMAMTVPPPDHVALGNATNRPLVDVQSPEATSMVSKASNASVATNGNHGDYDLKDYLADREVDTLDGCELG